MNPASPSPSAAFIDVTARLSLVMAVLSVIYSVLQLAVVALLGRIGVGDWLAAHHLPVPSSLQWLMDYATPLGLLMLLLSLAFLAVSWGLLARREWARIGFIAFLLLLALANFASLPLIAPLFSALTGMLPADILHTREGQQVLAQLQLSRWVVLVTAGISALAIAALHGWLALKLGKAEIRAQFH